MRNILIAAVIVIAGILTYLLIGNLNTTPVTNNDNEVQEQEDAEVDVGSGEYLDYERFDPQYYEGVRILYFFYSDSDQDSIALDIDIMNNMLQIPQDVVIVKITGTDQESVRTILGITEIAQLSEVDQNAVIKGSWNDISSLSELLQELN